MADKVLNGELNAAVAVLQANHKNTDGNLAEFKTLVNDRFNAMNKSRNSQHKEIKTLVTDVSTKLDGYKADSDEEDKKIRTKVHKLEIALYVVTVSGLGFGILGKYVFHFI